MITELKSSAEQKMKKALDMFCVELAKVRTGRANPAFLESVSVDYYGVPSPLSRVAGINVIDARTLSVSPWEKKMLPVIEKAIRDAGLGLNPKSVGELIHVPMPPLTEERRKELVKLVRQTAESTKISVRNVRRDINQDLKSAVKDKKISEDDERGAQEVIQKLTDRFIADIVKLLEEKEADLMKV